MRLLFLCLLLLLPAATAVSQGIEGSGYGETDDEDLSPDQAVSLGYDHRGASDKTTGEDDTSDQVTLIVIIVAVVALTLSVAAIVTIMLVRRHMNSHQQGVYSVPTEQDHKAV